MLIKNCLIFTFSASRIEMRPDELPNFLGNVIFADGRLPEAAKDWLKITMASADIDASGAYEGGAAMYDKVLK
jgi:hypothetical protein